MFEIGDRVIQKGYAPSIDGWKGTVISLPDPKSSAPYASIGYAVAFDNQSPYLHSCSGKCEDGHGYWVPPEYLKLIKSASGEKIVITHDGKTTLARLYEDNKVVKSAEAKCDPRDEFDFTVGAKLAFERLTGEEKKEPPFKVGDVVKVKAVGYHCFIDGTIGRVTMVSAASVAVNAYDPYKDRIMHQNIAFEDCEKVTK